jgi:uncharacterized cupin superfamily protein
MSEGYTVRHLDDFEQMEGSGGATWRLARKTLGAEAFGFNVVDLAPGGELPAHDESESGQEEVFVVLDGEGTIVAGEEEIPAPAGTFVRYGPEVKRTVRNRSDAPVRVLLIGVPGDSGYEPLSWA